MNLDKEDTLSRFAVLVDQKVGLIRSVDIVKVSETDPLVYLAYAEPCDTETLAGIVASNKGAACAVDVSDAVIRACGECIERYCSAFFDLDSLLYTSEQELRNSGLRALNGHYFFPFAQWQYALPHFPYEAPAPDRPVRWVRATSLSTGSDAYVPASCVFVPYRFGADGEPFTHMPISTGLAAGQSVNYCVDKGLCEIVERDALMLVWRARMSVPRVDPDSCLGISENIDRLLSCTARTDTTWFINLLTMDVDLPVLSAALIDDGYLPSTSFGIAAHPDPVQALQSAMEEAVLTRMLVNRSADARQPNGMDLGPVRTLRDHLIAHATSQDLRNRMRFLTDQGPRIPFSDLRNATDVSRSVASRIGEQDLEALTVEVTTPDVADCGFMVVRSLIPGMQPLDNDHAYRYEGGQRLLAVPRRLGYQVGLIGDLNTDPHPFP